MPRDWRLPAALAAAASLVVVSAAAQPVPPPPAPPPPQAAPAEPPETLETPYEDAPPSPPAPTPPPPPPVASPPIAPPAAPVVSTPPESPDTRPLLPIRAQRRLALTGEMGWNGLAGLGMVLTFNATPHVAVDLGGGVSLLGWKAGLRGRYNLLKSPLTPFVGAGVNMTSGLGRFTTEANDPDAQTSHEPATIDTTASYLIQGVVGLDYVYRRGFTLIGCVGYAHLLNKNNYEVLAGELTEDEQQAFDVFFKGGLVISLALGYSFQ
ncbi:MAG TPA: hypothetical protein VJN18_28940 [Polyangiaceae bacterium]|nr:hypothetical protein [Polyangiaceae bacterium]